MINEKGKFRSVRWSIIDFCKTDSDSAENLEAEVFNAMLITIIQFLQNYRSIDQKSLINYRTCKLKVDRQWLSMMLILNLTLS